MSRPRYTQDGVKVVQGEGSDYYCGHCSAYLTTSYGFKAQVCPECGMRNRGDFSMDLPSERVRRIAKTLSNGSEKYDSIVMGDAAVDLLSLVKEIEQLERHDRMFLGGDEPANPVIESSI